MRKSQIDHLVITAPTLELGASHVKQLLGVQPVPGGKHPQMGTHNCFVKLGERLYLEVIAIDPDAKPPNRVRWFELDDVEQQAQVRLAGWAVRTDDIKSASVAAPISFGEIVPMHRADFNWRISIPDDGSFPMQGAAPCLIQWDGSHPAEQMPDSACRLEALQIHHDKPQLVAATLAAIGFEEACAVSILDVETRTHIKALIHTPSGIKQLK